MCDCVVDRRLISKIFGDIGQTQRHSWLIILSVIIITSATAHEPRFAIDGT